MNVQESKCVPTLAPGTEQQWPEQDRDAQRGEAMMRFCLSSQPIDMARRNYPSSDDATWPRIFPGL